MDIGGVKFLFSTLFTRVDPNWSKEIARSFNDFKQSRFRSNSQFYTIADYDKCHSICKVFIENELENLENKPSVLVSHHVPYSSQMIPNYPFEYGGVLDSAFHVDLSIWMKKFNIKYCISGHTHVNHNPITIHGTTCLTNQLGYVHWGEHTKFNRNAFFEI